MVSGLCHSVLQLWNMIVHGYFDTLGDAAMGKGPDDKGLLRHSAAVLSVVAVAVAVAVRS